MNVPDALIGSNIFVYAWSSVDKEKHDIALRLFEKVWTRDVTYAVSVQNRAEFSSVLLTKGEKKENPMRYLHSSKSFMNFLTGKFLFMIQA